MRTIVFAALAAVTGAALAGGVPALAAPKPTPEQQLAKLLEGRVPGKPVSCIPLATTADKSQVIDKTAIVYGWGSTIYVNRPTNADQLGRDDIMVTKLYTPQLCRLDTIELHDRTTHFFTGFVGLNDFVPYTKADTKG